MLGFLKDTKRNFMQFIGHSISDIHDASFQPKVFHIPDIFVSVELTDHCNAKCISCPHSKKGNTHGKHDTGFMSFDLWKKLIDDIRESDFKILSIAPLWQGETLVHPQAQEFLRYLFEQNMQHRFVRGFNLNTNAISLTPQISDLFVEYAFFLEKTAPEMKGYMQIVLSLDAVSAEKFSEVKGVSPKVYPRVVDNIEYLLDARKRKGITYPNLVYQFIVMEENKDEAGDFIDFWSSELSSRQIDFEVTAACSSLRNTISLIQMITPNMEQSRKLHRQICSSLGLLKKEIPKARAEILHRNERKYKLCCAMYQNPVIHHSGIVVPCCTNLKLDLDLGNIKDNSLAEIWFGKKAQELRLAHINGDLSKFPRCKKCSSRPWPVASDDVVSYLVKMTKES